MKDILCATEVVLTFAAICAPCDGERLSRFEFTRPQMGVEFKLVFYAANSDVATSAADATYARITELNRKLSDYAADSELNRLCATAGTGQPVRVSDELFEVLGRSQALAARTQGAFDVTVGPFVRLWRRARKSKLLPTERRLARVRPAVGFQHVRLGFEPKTVELLVPHMRLDLGGIAKGYAADEALQVLRSRGIDRALVDAGGDVVIGDPPPGRKGWRIGIAPLEVDGAPSRYLTLAQSAIATSGDAFQFVEIGGQRYSHIVDPRTGLGLTHRQSVTVRARDGTTADSLATAVSVLGPVEGLQLIKATRGASALIVGVVDGNVSEFGAIEIEMQEAAED